MTIFARFSNFTSYSWTEGRGASGWTWRAWSRGRSRSESESWTPEFSLPWSQSFGRGMANSRWGMG